MGTDKALLEIEGEALAQRGRRALERAGCRPVRAIGGDAARLSALGLDVVPDLHPGEGPLGGIITALAALGADADIVVVLACDLVDADHRAVAAVCAPFDRPGGELIDVVVPRSDTRRHMHHAAWRTGTLPTLTAAFFAGERAPRRVLDLLRVHELTVASTLDPRWLADLDMPEDISHRRALSAVPLTDR